MNEFSEPTINKDDSNGVVSISGISMMEDAMDFYKPLKDWADQYLNSNKALVIDFELKKIRHCSKKVIKGSRRYAVTQQNIEKMMNYELFSFEEYCKKCFEPIEKRSEDRILEIVSAGKVMK